MTEKLLSYCRRLGDRYKYVLLVGAVGLALLLWPQKRESTAPAMPSPEAAEDLAAVVAQTEERIASILEEMEGVGRARVMLTVKSGGETVYAYDLSERLEGESALSRQQELVTLSGSGQQSPVERMRLSPVFQGAAVVCQGGDSYAVRLQVTQVIQSLTGITTDHIVISKMKE